MSSPCCHWAEKNEVTHVVPQAVGWKHAVLLIALHSPNWKEVPYGKKLKILQITFFLYFLVHCLSLYLFFRLAIKKGTMGRLSSIWLLMNPILPPYGKGWLKEVKAYFWWKALSVCMMYVCVPVHVCVRVCVCKLLHHNIIATWIKWRWGLFLILPRVHPLLCSTSFFSLPWPLHHFPLFPQYSLFKMKTP